MSDDDDTYRIEPRDGLRVFWNTNKTISLEQLETGRSEVESIVTVHPSDLAQLIAILQKMEKEFTGRAAGDGLLYKACHCPEGASKGRGDCPLAPCTCRCHPENR